MFRSLKIYPGLRIEIDGLLSILVGFGYGSQKAVVEEGDFSHRGGIVDVFPDGFEYPVRIELAPQF
jgi:transcription-repair coupling factor (superfamily II helicase)